MTRKDWLARYDVAAGIRWDPLPASANKDGIRHILTKDLPAIVENLEQKNQRRAERDRQNEGNR